MEATYNSKKIDPGLSQGLVLPLGQHGSGQSLRLADGEGVGSQARKQARARVQVWAARESGQMESRQGTGSQELNRESHR